MRAASTAALRALSTPTQATGTPGIEEHSSVEAPGDGGLRAERNPDHRQVGMRGHDARQRGGKPSAGDDHAQTPELAFFAYSATVSGSRWALITRSSCRIPRSSSS